jgi:hypothetical protein
MQSDIDSLPWSAEGRIIYRHVVPRIYPNCDLLLQNDTLHREMTKKESIRKALLQKALRSASKDIAPKDNADNGYCYS